MVNRNRKQSGFTLIETLITVGIILLIIGIAVPSYLSARKSGAQTAAAGNVKTMASNVSVYQSHNGGFPLTASLMGNGENATTAASTCLLDEELQTAAAAAWDGGGFVQSGYTFVYKAGGTAFASPQCGATTNVSPLWEATGVPVDVASGSTSYCADPTGEYQDSTGVATANDGKGCGADKYTIAVQ